MKKRVKKTLSTALIMSMLFTNSLQVLAGQWVERDSSWYHLDDEQQITKGWYQDSLHQWYHFDDNGKMNIGWYQDADGSRYYFAFANDGTEGLMKSGWYQDALKNWYFLDTRHEGYFGKAITSGWYWIDGYCYYFNEAGIMLANTTTPDGYEVNEDGQWVENGQIQYIYGKGISTKVNTGNRSSSSGGSSSGGGGSSSGGSGSGGGGSSSGGSGSGGGDSSSGGSSSGGGGSSSGGSSSGNGNSSEEGNVSEEAVYTLITNMDSVSVSENDQEIIFILQAEQDIDSAVLKNKNTSEKYEMFDDGDVDNNGDDIADDNHYSAIVNLDTSSEQRYEFEAEIMIEGQIASSNTVNINVYKELTDDELESMEGFEKGAEMKTLFVQASQAKTDSSKNQVRKNTEMILKSAKEDSAIYEYGWNTDQTAFAVEYANGAVAIFVLWEESEDHLTDALNSTIFNKHLATASDADFETASSSNADEDETDEEELFNDFDAVFLTKDEERVVDESVIIERPQLFAMTDSVGNDADGSMVKNDKVIFLSSFDENESHRTPATKKAHGYFDDANFSSEIVYVATVDDYKNLDDYGQIYVRSHGSLETKGIWIFKTETPVICLGESITKEKSKKYSSDIKEKRVLKYYYVDGTNGYVITPDFIRYYYDENDDLSNTFVYGGCCYSYYTDEMADAFLDSGALAYVGFSDSVYTYYNNDVLNKLTQLLIGGNTLGDSILEVKDKIGANDAAYGSKTPPAYLLYKGDDDMIIQSSSLVNGSFEEALYGWGYEGDCRVLTKLSELKPQNGKQMAIVSTGLGAVGDSNSYVYQTFKVPSDKTTLSFKYDYVSEEPMEFVDSEFDDTFEAYIGFLNGDTETIVKENINDSVWKELSGDYFYGGDDTTYHTGWKTKTFDLSDYVGQTISITFWTYDLGDSIYDSAVLIDDVKLQ